jgi:hypothetical protein
MRSNIRTYIHTNIHVQGRALRARQERYRTSLNDARKIPLVLYTERGHHRMPLPMDESNLFNDVGIEYSVYILIKIIE